MRAVYRGSAAQTPELAGGTVGAAGGALRRRRPAVVAPAPLLAVERPARLGPHGLRLRVRRGLRRGGRGGVVGHHEQDGRLGRLLGGARGARHEEGPRSEHRDAEHGDEEDEAPGRSLTAAEEAAHGGVLQRQRAARRR